jgi:hypothetical protein
MAEALQQRTIQFFGDDLVAIQRPDRTAESERGLSHAIPFWSENP